VTTLTHISSRVAILLAALAVAASASGAAVTSAGKAATSQTGYGWPVKPFDKEHPVRGFFGDPRTIFMAPPTMRGLMHGGGSFSFHQGIDVSAPDGTAVYPVVSGTVSAMTPAWVRVDSGGGRMFEYWHIAPSVHIGQSVQMDSTVLGHILRGAEHVHLTEYQGGRVVNPLQAGHIGPYTDTTRPRVESITFRQGAGGPAELPNFIRGKVELVASA
jgi:murein DD-endopeptidase MepM/ murein hydrolase activator NlpD